MLYLNSIIGQDYIGFIDLDEEDGGRLDMVIPDREGEETGDYISRPIFVDQGIPIGARSALTTVLYVSGRNDVCTYSSCSTDISNQLGDSFLYCSVASYQPSVLYEPYYVWTTMNSSIPQTRSNPLDCS